jgi:hypothetical protein
MPETVGKTRPKSDEAPEIIKQYLKQPGVFFKI